MLPEKVCHNCFGYMLDSQPGWLKCLGCGYMKKGKNSMISRQEVLMGRDEEFPLTPELEDNLSKLLIAANKLRTLYGEPMYVSSGYRPGHYNSDVGGAPNSSHQTCEAIDFHDTDNKLKNWITVEILEQCGLWQEAPESTPTWLHIQVRPIPSGHRIFKP